MSTAKKAMPPWRVYASNGVIEIQSKDFGTVVKWQGFDGTDYSYQANLKNACLMAAAPELLDALKKAKEMLFPSSDEYQQAEAAIAKATGAQHG